MNQPVRSIDSAEISMRYCRLLTSGMHRRIMHTMDETKRNPVIRVYPQTRAKLKVLAAQHEQTMQDFLEWLVEQQIQREKEAKGKHATQDI